MKTAGRVISVASGFWPKVLLKALTYEASDQAIESIEKAAQIPATI